MIFHMLPVENYPVSVFCTAQSPYFHILWYIFVWKARSTYESYVTTVHKCSVVHCQYDCIFEIISQHFNQLLVSNSYGAKKLKTDDATKSKFPQFSRSYRLKSAHSSYTNNIIIAKQILIYRYLTTRFLKYNYVPTL